jgi:uncharacterized protein with PIN domain
MVQIDNESNISTIICPDCEKPLKNADYLKIHTSVYCKKNKEYGFKVLKNCPKCNRNIDKLVYTTKTSHVRACNGGKTLECSKCNVIYIREKHFEKHLLTHELST